VAVDGTYTFADYLMPAEEATAPLPWSWVYGIQPFEGMRATYRWHVGLRIVLAASAAVAVVALARRHRFLGVALGGILLAEALSHTLLDARTRGTAFHDDLVAFEQDMESEFGDSRLRPSERVLFLPAANDYLVQSIAPRLQAFTYNISFDKEMSRIRPRQPPAVLHAIQAYDSGSLDREVVCELFRLDLVEAVVLPDFDLRWDSYSWPPNAERMAARREQNTALGLFTDPAFDVDTGPMSIILRENTAAPDGC
jgi:hypothetical protein